MRKGDIYKSKNPFKNNKVKIYDFKSGFIKYGYGAVRSSKGTGAPYYITEFDSCSEKEFFTLYKLYKKAPPQKIKINLIKKNVDHK